MRAKRALIFGVTGQDGAYLSKFLLKKKYTVHGVKRRSSTINTSRIDDIYSDPLVKKNNFFLHYGDVTDSISIFNLIKKTKPSEIYNLAAQSHVAVSFEIPEYTTNADALGTLRILECIVKINKKIKFYQAGSSEMFGKVFETPQTEKTPFYPRSPYGVAKLFSHWITINYRESYKLFACNGILFNHESPLRGETFVTKKVVSALCKIKLKKQKKLFIGNLYAKRDWGHASDYVQAMWKILQNNKPDDFVICTGKQYTIKQFINMVANQLKIKVIWRGKGVNEKGYDQFNNCIIECSKKYFRPAEVDTLKGDYSKARKQLNWRPKHNIHSLIKDMINYEINILKNA
ncbi:GDP-mannose 4,6-dehydratase [Candidatus Pelagibacter sp.]|nr:GDP-mannose 4,6-dehydratase [Candidatus Pelagibacter sp.]